MARLSAGTPMVVLLALLAVGMIVTGLASLLSGAAFINVERGWTMVIAGTTGASAGAVLLGLALCAARLGRIAGAALDMREGVLRVEELTAERAPVAIRPAAPAPASAPPAPGLPDLPPVHASPAGPDQSELVVGQYSSGGSSYVMYGDGSIQAQLPDGPRRFGSIDELRAYASGPGRG